MTIKRTPRAKRLGDVIAQFAEHERTAEVQRVVEFARPDQIEMPSHLTVPQIAMILDVRRQAIHDRINRGTMKARVIYGEKMVRSCDVVRALEEKRRKK
jgi:hypothetical protein